MKKFLTTIFMGSIVATNLWADERLPVIPPESYNEEQQAAAAVFLEARNAPVFGPFQPLMHSPDVMNLARSMGDYLRYKSALGNTLSELVILITAREWTQDYEWFVHHPIALKAGISDDTADAIAEGRRPTNMSDDEEIVYNFSTELHRNKSVSDETYQLAQQRFGDKGIVDLTGINAYYTLLAMQMNVAQYKPPEGAQKLPRFPD
ncbi:MAG TPA: 4-carboxy muconolactone decarboxylase [Gammaproteobacteria bacterium]|nr:4-carboxy muconolactone decarboxylase [Gammaproteobacteria bacterium]